jgi:hypothetical protein
MKAYSVYIFVQSGSHTRYNEKEHSGADVPDFPAVLKRKGKDGTPKGTRYVTFEQVQDKSGHIKKYDYAIGLGSEKVKGEGKKKRKRKNCTSFSFSPEYPHKCAGDYKGYATLIELTPDEKELTVRFFKDEKLPKVTLFERWVNGELPDTVEIDAVPLPQGEKKADIGGTSA